MASYSTENKADRKSFSKLAVAYVSDDRWQSWSSRAFGQRLRFGHQLGEHLHVEAGYMRLHQEYSSIAVSSLPDRNGELISSSYQLVRALGR